MLFLRHQNRQTTALSLAGLLFRRGVSHRPSLRPFVGVCSFFPYPMKPSPNPGPPALLRLHELDALLSASDVVSDMTAFSPDARAF
jgi:hypothetical protein